MKVSVINTKNPYHGAIKALELIDAKKYFKREEKILIKPNYVTDDLPETGVTVFPQVVKAIVDYFLQNKFKNLVVGEGGISEHDTMKTFEKVGLVDVLENVELMDLNRDERVEVEIPGATCLKKVNVAKTFIFCDSIVSVSKLKVHSIAKTTLCMKNMMGGILPKSIMHSNIHEKIVDLNRVFRARLNLIDGIVGCQTSETACDPVNSNVVVAGENPVAVDSVGSYLMGFSPREIEYLELARREGLGTNILEEIEILGDSVESLKKMYRI